MGFKKGVVSSPNGRGKGVLNKDTAKVRAYVLDIVQGNGKRLKKEIESLKGKQYVDAVLQLMEYCAPKLARVEQVGEGSGNTYNIMITNGAQSNGKDNGQATNGAVIVIEPTDE